jgi:hypothetical protein
MRGAVLVMLILPVLTGCGDNIVEIGGLSGSASPGRVSLMNNWSRTIWAEHTDEGGNVARTTIQPGETKVISGNYVFDGGDDVYFVLTFNWRSLSKRIRVTVDGNVLVIINMVRGQGDVLAENCEILEGVVT